MSNIANSAIQPYLCFEGRCQEALDFYKKALGAEIGMVMRFKDSPEPPKGDCGGGNPEAIMHSSFTVKGATILASDGRCQGNPKFEGIFLSLTVKSEAEADQAFNGLAEGGQVIMPLMKTFYSPRFGMLTDKFGVGWMIYMAGPQP
jgi:PhnB protein